MKERSDRGRMKAKAKIECGREFGVEKKKRGGEGGRDSARRCQTLGKEIRVNPRKEGE